MTYLLLQIINLWRYKNQSDFGTVYVNVLCKHRKQKISALQVTTSYTSDFEEGRQVSVYLVIHQSDRIRSIFIFRCKTPSSKSGFYKISVCLQLLQRLRHLDQIHTKHIFGVPRKYFGKFSKSSPILVKKNPKKPG